MNETKQGHTPGTWKAEAYNSRMGSLISYGNIGKGETIGIVFAQHDDAEARANAHLIAAAPELLAALEGILDFEDSYTLRSWDDVCLDARAAIERARKGKGDTL